MSDTDGERIFDEHAALIGHVTIAWNDLTHLVFWFFENLSGMTQQEADAVFFTIRNDRSQRNMLRKLANATKRGPPEICADLVKELDALDKLATVRNEATHSGWALEMAWQEDESGEPTKWDKPRLVKMRASGVGDDGFTARFEKLRTDLTDCYGRMFDVWKRLNAWQREQTKS